MAFIYVLIATAPQYEHSVYSEVLELSETVETNPLFGEYSLITRAKLDDLKDTGKFVEEKIKTIKGVLATKTLSCFS